MKIRITKEWLQAQLKAMEEAGVTEIPDVGVPEQPTSAIMRCKLFVAEGSYRKFGQGNKHMNIRMGGVWEGSTEKQKTSENAVFGAWTPNAGFSADIHNPALFESFQLNQQFYVDFTPAPTEGQALYPLKDITDL